MTFDEKRMKGDELIQVDVTEYRFLQKYGKCSNKSLFNQVSILCVKHNAFLATFLTLLR